MTVLGTDEVLKPSEPSERRKQIIVLTQPRGYLLTDLAQELIRNDFNGIDIGIRTLTSIKDHVDLLEDPDLDDVVAVYYVENGNKPLLDVYLPELRLKVSEITIKEIVAGKEEGLEAKVVEEIRKRKSQRHRPDVLYPNVSVWLGDTPYVRKRVDGIRAFYEDGSHKDLPAEYMAGVNAKTTNHYTHGIPALSVTGDDSILIEHLEGPITYELNRAIKRKVRNIDIKTRNHKNESAEKRKLERRKGKLLTIRNALLYTQLMRLAEHQVNPYIPRDDNGDPIVTNPDVNGNYRTNLHNIFTDKLNTFERVVSENCEDFLSAYTGLFEGQIVRYSDCYSRNHGIRTGKITGSLDDVVNETSGLSKSDVGEWIHKRYMHFDWHRVTKLAVDLEDFWHIVDDPGNDIDEDTQLRLYCLFMAMKQYYTDKQKERSSIDDENFERLQKKIKKQKLFDVNEIKELAPDFPIDRKYFFAAKAYRNLRWFGLVHNIYLEKYQQEIRSAKESIVATLRQGIEEGRIESEKGSYVNRFDESGRIGDLRFVISKLSRAEDEELLANGITYDIDNVGEKFYKMFEGKRTQDKKRKAKTFVRSLNTYLASVRRSIEYTSDQKIYLERANHAFNRLVMEELGGEWELKTEDNKYAVKRTNGSRVALVCNGKEITETMDYITALNDLTDNYSTSGNEIGSTGNMNERVVRIAKAVGMSYVTAKELEKLQS